MLEIEKYTPKENWIVGLLWDEGYFFFKTIRKELTRYMEFVFNSDAKIAVDTEEDWETPTDSEGRYYLEPQKQEHAYQIFTGIYPSTAQLYLSYPKRTDRGSIIAERDIPGKIGWWDGEDSPYRDPSPMTELWTVDDKYPYFSPLNQGISGEAIRIYASFYINIYTYQVIENRNIQEKIIRGDKRATIVTMGDPEQPIAAPAWMLKLHRKAMIKPEDVEVNV